MRPISKPLLLVLLLVVGVATGVRSVLAQTLTGRVVSVHDGDTLTLLTQEKRPVKVRLHGVDAPELR